MKKLTKTLRRDWANIQRYVCFDDMQTTPHTWQVFLSVASLLYRIPRKEVANRVKFR